MKNQKKFNARKNAQNEFKVYNSNLTTPLLSKKPINYSIQNDSKEIILDVKDAPRDTSSLAEVNISGIMVEQKNYWRELHHSMSQVGNSHRKKQVCLGLGFLSGLLLLGYFLYLSKQIDAHSAIDNSQLTVNWYQQPINVTTDNMTCAEAYPSPPAGCDENYEPVGVPVNVSCMHLLQQICDNCIIKGTNNDDDGGALVVPLLAMLLENPQYLVPDSCYLGNRLPLSLVASAIAIFGLIIGCLCRCFKTCYDRSKRQVTERAGLFVRPGMEQKLVQQKAQEVTLFELLKKILFDQVGGKDPLNIIVKYLEDDIFFEYHWKQLEEVREHLSTVLTDEESKQDKESKKYKKSEEFNQKDQDRPVDTVMDFISPPRFSF